MHLTLNTLCKINMIRGIIESANYECDECGSSNTLKYNSSIMVDNILTLNYNMTCKNCYNDKLISISIDRNNNIEVYDG